jgi:hypothetical protein
MPLHHAFLQLFDTWLGTLLMGMNVGIVYILAYVHIMYLCTLSRTKNIALFEGYRTSYVIPRSL